ncbi:T9SS type A sorting domain-containing protein [Flavobacterium sp. CYK-55]|uniref:T9SS type A sorting domain-containing protein n=1 Tax=Flavobacterium sp. CYK-55 TaxID=2835529 RepID=UPI001BCDD813|nr:T9SS type A sorting domain-containing protein [Flavobacterium sp. CYK-55]MBS7786513.1 T9SS type A sorting domain-containing protein [Flavobacterium sp. CYK-55]
MKHTYGCYLRLLPLIFLCQMLNAQNNWDGDNAIGEFTLCDNWFGNSCPAVWNATTDLNIQLKNSGFQTTMYLNYGSWIDLNNLTYFASYTPSVNQFDADGPVGNENGINFYGKIENYSPNHTQVFNLPFHGRNATVIEINPINGGLTFNRPILNSGNRNFNIWGPNSRKLTLNSYPAGNGSVGLYIKQYSIVEVNYNDPASLSGGYFVEEGELWVNSAGVIQGPIQVGNGTTAVNKLYISHASTATTVANNISVPTSSANATIGALNTSNTHTYSGNINLNNNTVNFDEVSAGGTVNFTGGISGTGGMLKIGAGLVRLSNSCTYTGTTTINAGTLQYGVANAISNSSNVILNGGKFSTGATTGYSDTVGTLTLTDNSTIELGTGTHTLNFANSNAVAWTAGRTLTITGWTNSCSGAKIFVGTDNTGLTTTQLAQITFQGYAAGASISPVGELIPGNIVLTATGGTLLAKYSTLKAAFDAMNLSTHLGVINISVLNDINEGANTAALNQVAGITSVLIQPGGCGPRTITGTGNTGGSNPLIDLNGADNVTIDGLNTNGNSLTISNTSTSAAGGTSTIRFLTDATNNVITNCSILGSATGPGATATGNIFFGAAAVTTGNDNNTVSYCNIGPAGGNLPTKGIHFTGTSGRENSGIIITNNNIYDYFNATVESAGVYVGVGTSTCTFSNNRFYQTANRAQTTASQHSAIKIATGATGNGFLISGNIIGYRSSSGTLTYPFNGIAGTSFTPISLSVGTTATTVQNNTIAGIMYNINTAAAGTIFQGISSTGSGTVNVIGNTFGLTTGTLGFFSTSTAGGNIFFINLSGTGTMNIQNNIVQSVTTGNSLGSAAFNITGISVAGTAAYNISNNTIGHTTPANSITMGTLGTSTTAATFTGITSSATGNLTVGSSGNSNTIQNITINPAANNAFIGFSNSGANTATSISYNVVKGVSFAAGSSTGSTFRGINNTGAVTGTIDLNNNSFGVSGTGMVSYSAANTGTLIVFNNTAGGATAALSVQNNDIQGITHAGATTCAHTYITNTAATLSQNISGNTFTNLNAATTGAVAMIVDNVILSATGTINIDSNSIVTGFTTTTTNLTLVSCTGASFTGAAISCSNNNFSNITGSSVAILSVINLGTVSNFQTKTISNNTLSNFTLGVVGITAINAGNIGGTSTISNNTITGLSNNSTISGIIIGAYNTGATLNCTSNTLNNFNTTTAIYGVSSSSATVATATENISNNTIGSLITSGASIVYGIYSTGVVSNKIINNNNLTTFNSNGNFTYGINHSGGSTVAITNNTISNFSQNNPNTIYGINSSAASTTNTITGNQINNIVNTGSGVFSLIYGINYTGAVAATISNNTISNLESASTNANPTIGINLGMTVAGNTVSGNTIYGLNGSLTSAGTTNVCAIISSSTTAGGNISGNRIYSLSNGTTSTTSMIVGFKPNGGSWTVHNNMISLINNQTVSAYGVYDSGATGARKYFYNSIYIGGTNAGSNPSAAMQYNAGAGTVDIKNNILVNEQNNSGKNYAIANTAANFTGMTMNYNVLNASNINMVAINNTTDQNFAGWKSASGLDANSLSGIVVPFANTATADLHITTTCNDLESTGTPVTVTTDYDGVTRNATTPDIGADEFAGSAPAAITLSPATLTVCAGSGIAITASSTDATYAYTWSPATGLSATTGATVTATPAATTTYIVTGTSPSGCTKSKSFVVTVNPLPTAITVSPSSVNSCPNIIQTLTVTPNPSTMIPIGTPNSNTAVVGNTPYRQASSTQLRIQYLVTKAELNAAGINNATNLKSISFNVTSAGTGTMPTYDISMAHTAAAALTATYIATGFTTVYNGVNILPVNGINTHTFATPFAWDGTSNIVINICHTATGTGLNPFSLVTLCTPATTSTTSRTGGGSCTAASGTTNADKPVIYFEVDAPITWSPTTNLYADALATTAYNPTVHTNMPTIYAKPTVATTYTASVTNTVTGCASTSTGAITMNPNIWNGTTWSLGAPSGTTNLEFNGNFTSSANLSGCNCSVTSGTIVFNDPATLTLSGGLNVSGGSLTFMNNASLLQTNDSSSNSGTVTIERITQPMYKFDYTYWGSPLTQGSGYTLGMLSPNTLIDKYFSWTPTIANAGGNWAFETQATVMDPRKGYIVRAPQSFSPNPLVKTTYTANFVGIPNNGVISSPILHGTLALGVNDDKYNLLGNPYPSALDAQAFLTDPANTPIIDGTIYFWTHNSPISASNPNPFYGTFALNYSSNDYAAWNSLGAVGFRGIQAISGGAVPNGYISVGQGFFTKSSGTAPSPSPVTFKNAMRVAGNNSQFFRNATVANHRFWVDLIDNSGSFSQILIGYKDDATLGWDRMYDGSPMDEGSGLTLYSIIPDRHLSIQARPLPFDQQDQVILGYKATHPDTYSFGLDSVDGMFDNQDIFIEDTQLNIIHDLKQNPYVFTSEAGTFNERFVLRYNNTALTNANFDEQNVSVGIMQHELMAQSNAQIKTIEVFDITGKLIARYEPQSNQFKTLFNFAQGVYLARITLDNGKVSSKKIMN